MRSIVWSSDQEWCWVKVWIIELRLPWSLGLDKPASDERMGITSTEAHSVSSTSQYTVFKCKGISSATTQYTKAWLKSSNFFFVGVKITVKSNGNMFHWFKKRCCCGVTYLAFVINSTCLLELPLLSITVANCSRKTQTTQKSCYASGIKHNMKKSVFCKSRANSQNLFSCCNDPHNGRHIVIYRVYDMWKK